MRGTDFRVDGFVGYHYLHQRMKAFGDVQTADNTQICTPSIPDIVALIVEDDTWQAHLPLHAGWRLNIEGAYLPYVWFNGTDNDLLRPDLPVRFDAFSAAGTRVAARGTN